MITKVRSNILALAGLERVSLVLKFSVCCLPADFLIHSM